jgi:6-phosphogluconolactonase
MIIVHDKDTEAGRPTVHVVADLAAGAGPLLARAIQDAVRRTGRCRLGLCGGSTPAPLFAWLRHNLDHRLYRNLWLTWVDERHLPVDGEAIPDNWQGFHADSNFRLAAEHWLGHVPMPGKHTLPMSLGGSLEDEVRRFGRAFAVAFDGGLDVQVLGAGPDGHVGAVFPDHPGMAVDDLCFAVHDSPKPPSERIALALPVLRRTPVTVLLATGANKAEMLQRAYNADESLPLGCLLANQPGTEHHWFVDTPAATSLLQSLTNR